MITINEIAKIAGVHRSTVDKVLHNRVGVSDEVRKKIQKIIKETGYQPNLAGRLLQKQGHVFRIAAVLARVDATDHILKGMRAEVSRQNAYTIEIKEYITDFTDSDRQAEILHQLLDEGIDGIVVSPIYSENVKIAMNRAGEMGVALVTVNSALDLGYRLCYVGMDSLRASRVAGRMMGLFLQEKGDVAIISSSQFAENNNYDVILRENGFRDFIRETYPDIEIVSLIESFESPQVSYEKTCELLASYPGLKGIYVTCGRAVDVGRALLDQKKEKDIRVITYEDYPEIQELIKNGVIDATLGSDLLQQGALPVKIIMDYLVFKKKPEQEKIFTEIQIMVKESIA